MKLNDKPPPRRGRKARRASLRQSSKRVARCVPMNRWKEKTRRGVRAVLSDAIGKTLLRRRATGSGRPVVQNSCHCFEIRRDRAVVTRRHAAPASRRLVADERADAADSSDDVQAMDLCDNRPRSTPCCVGTSGPGRPTDVRGRPDPPRASGMSCVALCEKAGYAGLENIATFALEVSSLANSRLPRTIKTLGRDNRIGWDNRRCILEELLLKYGGRAADGRGRIHRLLRKYPRARRRHSARPGRWRGGRP